MATVAGYLVVGKKAGLKYYYLQTVGEWTTDFKKISIEDLSEEKIEMDMSDYPDMDKEYDHEEITLEGNYWD